MGGGTSKTTQVQTYLTDSLTEIVNEELTEEYTSLVQSGVTNQLIQDVAFLPWDGCPWWSPPRNLSVRQESVSAGIIAKSVERVNIGDLTAKLSNRIEALSSNKVEKRKDGLLAFTDDTELEQKISVTDITRQKIERRIKDTVQTIINQKIETTQTIQRATFYLPCGDTTVTQQSLTQVMASVFAKNVTETAMESQEVREWVTKVTGEDKQHTTDMFNSLFNNAAAAVGSIAGAFGSIGMAGILIAGAVGVLILMMLFGGGGGGDSD